MKHAMKNPTILNVTKITYVGSPTKEEVIEFLGGILGVRVSGYELLH